jgi:twitching motility protein PilU
MEKSENLGMQSFDSALYQLYRAGRIDREEALRNADSPNNLRLRINLNKDKASTVKKPAAPSSLSLIEDFDEEASVSA